MSEDGKKLLLFLVLGLALCLPFAVGQGGGCGLAGTAPINQPGLYVLEIYNSSKMRDLTPQRVSAVSSNRVPAYIESKGGKFKRFDVAAETAGMDEPWKSAFARPRTEDFWVIVSNSRRGGTEQPLPATDDDYLALVKKYAE